MPSAEIHSRRRAGALAAAAAAMAGAVWAARAFGRFTVTGDSMRPALEPGDRLVVGPLGRPTRDAIVIVADPRSPDRLMAKRIAALPGEGALIEGARISPGPGEVAVLGDNLDASTDSREFGPVALALIRGRAWYRYFPEGRAGWL